MPSQEIMNYPVFTGRNYENSYFQNLTLIRPLQYRNFNIIAKGTSIPVRIPKILSFARFSISILGTIDLWEIHRQAQEALSQEGHNDDAKSSDDRQEWMGVAFADMSREQQLAVQREKHLTCTITAVRFPASQRMTLQRRQVMVSELYVASYARHFPS